MGDERQPRPKDEENRRATASAEAIFDLYVQPPDESPILFHYTGPHSLVRIANESKIFATNIRYLNDASEYTFTHQLFVGRLTQFIEDAAKEEVVLYLEFVRNRLVGITPRDADYYVVSFSVNGDVLSQWRSYCPPGGGYSIGLSAEELMKAATKKISLFPNPWHLVRCEYDGEEQIKRVDDVIRESVEAFKYFDDSFDNGISKYLRREITAIPSILNGLVPDILNAVVELAPIFKHQAFAHEEEWRLVSPRIIDGDPCINFRGGDFSVIPFVFFDLPPIRECIVGPSVDQSLSARAVEQLCQVPIARRSTIPYRSLSSKG